MSAVYFVLLLGGLIFFHELGHYTMARLSRVHVVVFSIGFGPALLRWARRGTEYRIAAFPLGGYVKLLGDDPTEEVPEHLADGAFRNKGLWPRFWIVSGGPLFNLILPFLVYLTFGLTAQQVEPAVVGSVAAGSPAEEAGLQTGDRIVEIEGEPISAWWQLSRAIQPRYNKPTTLVYERDGVRHRVENLVPEKQRDYLAPELGIYDRVGRIGVAARMPLLVLDVRKGSRAEAAGVRSGDVLTAIDGKPVRRWEDVQAYLDRPSSEPARLTLRRTLKGAAPQVIELSLALGPDVGLRWGELVVKEVEPGPLADAGLKVGDAILALDGEAPSTWAEVESRMRSAYRDHAESGKPGVATAVLRIERAGMPMDLKVKLYGQTKKTRVKTELTDFFSGVRTASRYDTADPVENDHRFAYAAYLASTKPIRFIRLTLYGIAGLFVGKVSFKEMGGPILVANIASATADEGWAYFFQVMAVLSISLGLLNLLPIPVLDGGHILFLLIEAIQRRPISLKAVSWCDRSRPTWGLPSSSP